MAIIVPDYFGEAFSRSYLQAQHYARQEAERKRAEEDLRKSLEVMAGTNEPLPEDTTMRPTVVQTPTAPLPGQGTVATQPSAPVADMPPVQTQTTTADLPQKDPYKEGLKNIELAYREKIKNVTQMKNPTLALNFLQQSMQERDIAKAEHNSAAFQSTLNEIMNNPNLTPAQRIGMAVKANSTFKAGFKVGDIFKMFEPEKPISVAAGTTLLDPRTMQPMYTAPKDQSMTPYQQATLGLRRQELSLKEQKDPKKPEWEKEHHNYEKTHGMTDAQLVNEYWAMSQDPAQSALITPDKQAKYNVATARVNKYLAQPNLTADEQEFLSGIDRSKVSKEEGFKMLQQYRMNKLNGIRQ